MEIPSDPNKINVAKINHDIEQLHYLESLGKSEPGNGQLIKNLQQIKELIQQSKKDSVSLTDTVSELVGFNHFTPKITNRPGRKTFPVLNSNLTITKKSSVTIVDDFLDLRALEELRNFCLESKFWNQTRPFQTYLLTDNNFHCGLLTQIEEEMRLKFAPLIDNKKLATCWGIKYNYQELGVPAHADNGDLNANFWISPDSCNLDKSTGGMTIFELKPKSTWQWPLQIDNAEIEEYIKQESPEEIHVPYKANRLVMFNSKQFHKTCPVNFGPGYADRRINITYVFRNQP